MIIKCPGCNGALEYDVISDKMSCSHCGNSYSMWELENTSPTTAEAEEACSDEEMMEYKVYRCTACNAQLMINGVESSTFCAYCGQPTIVYDRISRSRKPRYIIPFSVSKDRAVNLIRSRFTAGFFVPKDIKNFKPEVVRGIYIPYRLVDLEYRDSALISADVSKGDDTVTRYFYRDAKSDFIQMPVDASITLQDASSIRLEPFALKALRDFSPEYLSGYYADCSDETEKHAEYKAEKRAGELFREALFRTVNGNNKRIVDEFSKVTIKKNEYVLLPVWFMVFKYKGKSRTIMVNGQTGKVVGAVPYAKSAVWSFFATLSALFSVFTVGFVHIFSDPKLLGNVIMNFHVYLIILVAFVCYKTNRLYKSYKKSQELTDDAGFSRYVRNRQEV